MPFVVESHGWLHPDAVVVLGRLARNAEAALGSRCGEMVGYLKRLVAIGLQRGNAWLERNARDRSRGSWGGAVGAGLIVARGA